MILLTIFRQGYKPTFNQAGPSRSIDLYLELSTLWKAIILKVCVDDQAQIQELCSGKDQSKNAQGHQQPETVDDIDVS